MATFLRSFAELAANVNLPAKKEKKQKKQIPHNPATYSNVALCCGEHAAQIWKFMQNQESCGRFGEKGFILHTLDNLIAVTNYDIKTVQDSVIKLIQNGFARPAANGTQIKAA